MVYFNRKSRTPCTGFTTDYFQQEAHTRKQLQQLLHLQQVTCSAQGRLESIAWANSTISAKKIGVD